MCLAVPTQVVEILPNTMVKVKVGNSSTLLTCSAMLLPEPPCSQSERSAANWLVTWRGLRPR